MLFESVVHRFGVDSGVGREGKDYPVQGCYLEVIENEKLVWTDALEAGFRPAKDLFFTAVITLEPHEKDTKYTAIAIHVPTPANSVRRSRTRADKVCAGWLASGN